MDIAFNTNEWKPAQGAVGTPNHPDWHGLQARLWAARQAWQVLGRRQRGKNASGSGSFHDASAACLASIGSASAAVNQNDSANRNCGRANLGAAAGSSSTGGRG